MISNTLSDAISKIRRYQRLYPNAYPECAEQLNNLLEQMDVVRKNLDALPAPHPATANAAGAWEDLRDAARESVWDALNGQLNRRPDL